MLSIKDIEELCKELNIIFKENNIDPHIEKLWDEYKRDYNYMRFDETNVGI